MKKSVVYGGLLFSVIALSTSAIFVKLAAAPSAITAFYRLFFALLVIAPFVLLSRNRRAELIALSRRQLLQSLVSGVMLAVHYILWFESLRYTSVASSTVIVTLQPVFTMLFAYLLSREKQRPLAVIGCVVALTGSFLIGWGDFQSGLLALWGDVLALVAAAIISGYFFLGERVRRQVSAVVYTMLGYTGSAVFLFIYAIVKGDSFTDYPAETWLSFAGLALVPTIMGQFIFNLLLKWLPATTISMSILGEPIGTCILAYLIWQEQIGLQQGIGMLVILGGLGLYFFSGNQKKQSA